MEEMDEFSKSHNPEVSTNNYMGPRSSKRSFSSAVILSLGLLSIFLLVGLITLRVYCVSATSSNISSMTEDGNHLKANLSTLRNKLSSVTEERDLLHTHLTEQAEELKRLQSGHAAEHLSEMTNQLSSVTEERDLLRVKLTEKAEELEKLQSLFKQSVSKNKTCPSGWSMFCGSCYLRPEKTGSWDEGRSDCRNRGADLVVIDSSDEQDFLVRFTKKMTWIGLNDKEEQGRWKWVDGTPLTLTYWSNRQPDNGGGDPQWGEEDCVHIRTDGNTLWNDLSCGNSLPWVCEKQP